MRHFKPQYLAIIPLLSLLASSPSQILNHPQYRHMASVQELNPRYEAIVKQVNKDALLKDRKITLDSFNTKLEKLTSQIDLEKKEFKKNQSDKDVVLKQKDQTESLAIKVLLLELDLEQLNSKEDIGGENSNVLSHVMADLKKSVESLLDQVSVNEELVEEEEAAKVSHQKNDPDETVAKEDKPGKKDEEDIKKKTEEARLAEIARQEKLICDLESKNTALNSQLTALVQDQKDIMKTLMGLSQMMIQMSQGQRNQPPTNPYGSNWFAFQQSPYQYNQPLVSGNWIYSSNGYSPSQPNIFATLPVQQQSVYPNQMYQQPQVQTPVQQTYQQSNWNLAPQNYFSDPRYDTQPMTIGSFGNEHFSYNFAPTSINNG